MKRILLLIAAIACIATGAWCQAAITFSGPKVHEFGNVRQDAGSVTHVFEFTNTGDKPLVIVDAKASCGCTQPKYPMEPVKPGQKGSIKVTFLPKSQSGEFNKTIKVRTNAPQSKKITLRIKGVVIPK